MAFTSRQIDRPVSEVWSALIDPDTYPAWLIGAADIRDVDPDWPLVGTSFHHRVGIRPLSIPDRSTVEAIDAPEMLTLRVRARPFVSAQVVFRLVGDDDRCVVTMQEEPRLRLIGNLVRPMLDPSIHIRNHRSLRRLDQLLTRAEK